ncbi:universal stress protein [Thalassobaculum sp. OXR-137]|uniref:universal stress protein n=1 Tax=Thalassobaculum sp. OXR-137 TaxID=3100173 RepID=UPI002AC8F729|nr:universal stress protein [Thalassobaculum sp. OXR-137]WPZ34707.1 universal stress protein [Thalassobaculum sp. OXR-137]
MTDTILVPVDLEHTEKLTKALDVAAAIAKTEQAEVCFLGVTDSEPSAVAATPEAYATKLTAFAEDQARQRGISAKSNAVIVHDTPAELAKAILGGAEEAGADLIVMASHLPGLQEHVFATNAGYIANHAPISVYVVR